MIQEKLYMNVSDRYSFLLLACLLLFMQQAGAKRVTERKAVESARMFLANLQGKSIENFPEMSVVRKNARYYLVSGRNGWCVVNATDDSPTVLGYSDSGSIDPDNLPPAMKEWLERYAQAKSSAITDTGDWQPIAPMLKTAWGQRAPYNLMTPLVPNADSTAFDHAPTGCGATAVAQVMYYHRWPENNTASIPVYDQINYDSITAVLPPTRFQWELMKESYEPTDTSSSAKALAELMKYVGEGIRMYYDYNGSGTTIFRIVNSMIILFDYSSDIAVPRPLEYNEMTGRPLQLIFPQLLYRELEKGNPAVLTGFLNPINYGHFFVCDGYAGNGYFHFNWGWDGNGNGNFLYDDIQVDYKGEPQKASVAQLITNLEPSYKLPQPRFVIGSIKTPTAVIKRDNLTEDFILSASVNSYSYLPECIDMDAGLALYDNDRLVLLLDSIRLNSCQFPVYDCSDMHVTASVNDGVYQLKAVSKPADSQTWYPDANSDLFYITVRIQGLELRLEPASADILSVPDVKAISVIGNDRIYDLQGRRLTTEPKRGVYIKGGKLRVKSGM